MDAAINNMGPNDLLGIQNMRITRGLFIKTGSWGLSYSELGLGHLTTKSVDWSTISTMYRHPGITLSRDKLVAVKEKYNVKVIRDKSKADIEIVSEKTYMSLLNNKYSVSLSSLSDFKLMFYKHKDAFDEEVIEKLCQIFEDPDRQLDVIALTQRYSYYDSGSYTQECNDLFKEMDTLPTNHLNYISSLNVEAYKHLCNNQSKTVLDTYVNGIASEDSVVINEEIYKKISLMLESVNQDDITMGMTMMANCNIDKSKTSLGLLFFHYMENLKHMKTWNQVGFKSLRKSFDKYMIGGWNSGHTSRYTKLIHTLAEDGALTTNSVESVLDLVFKNVLSSAGFTTGEAKLPDGDTCAFQIERPNVTLSDKYKQKIKTENKTLSELTLEVAADLPF